MTKILIDLATAQQALNLIERLNLRGWILADFEDEVYASIAALKAALAQPPLPEQEQAKPVQEPTPWRDMIVVTLVREGINKHRARKLADHFAAQPVQDANRYKWLRDRLQVRYMQALTGKTRQGLVMRVGHGFLDSTIYPESGWTDPLYFNECRQNVDAAIDAAIEAANNIKEQP